MVTLAKATFGPVKANLGSAAASIMASPAFQVLSANRGQQLDSSTPQSLHGTISILPTAPDPTTLYYEYHYVSACRNLDFHYSLSQFVSRTPAHSETSERAYSASPEQLEILALSKKDSSAAHFLRSIVCLVSLLDAWSGSPSAAMTILAVTLEPWNGDAVPRWIERFRHQSRVWEPACLEIEWFLNNAKFGPGKIAWAKLRDDIGDWRWLGAVSGAREVALEKLQEHSLIEVHSPIEGEDTFAYFRSVIPVVIFMVAYLRWGRLREVHFATELPDAISWSERRFEIDMYRAVEACQFIRAFHDMGASLTIIRDD